MKKALLLLFFLLLPIANAQLITIGVQPSRVVLDFYKSSSYKIEFGFSNDAGEVDAIYTLEPDDCLKDIIKDYPKEVLVPKGTNRISNPVRVWITFKPDYKGSKTCFLYVYARPEGVSEEGGALRIRPSVGIKIEINQPESESISYTPPSSTSTVSLPLPIQEEENYDKEQTVNQPTQTPTPKTVQEPQKQKQAEIEVKGKSFPMWIV
ncbi:MAG TPA: hypothetical protein ENG56_00300, partial [Candidatus Aenigmarchaeota archaeon]|nr:hypothetical protein [Candidatus Aenigmarchaeota archaeon]